METLNISIIQLLIGLLLILIPGYILYYYQTGIVKDMFVSVARMVIQLFLVGFYLNYLFAWNNIFVNVGWLMLMTGVCAVNMINRIHLSKRKMFVPIYFAVFISLSFIASYFLKLVIGMENLFDSRYFIPICGILLGNILSSSVIGINSFYSSIVREQQMYNYLLGNGATTEEAQRPFIRQALIKAFNPAIASMAVMGLIALPGTMIGQILGGSSPNLSIRYQIMIMVINFSASMLSVLISLHLSVKYTFDKYGGIKDGVILD
ncbi:MAG: ABC transporter permease [Bacteroidales bacterium]|nr:ABC transporter permease [Bacteroidales bacterium]